MTHNSFQRSENQNEENEIDKILDDIDESHLQDEMEENDVVVGQVDQDEDIYKYAGYANAKYGDLGDETQKICDMKCITSLHQLKILLGNRCRFENCNAALARVNHYVLQYCIKLEWICCKDHCGFWYSSQSYGPGLAINYIVNTSLLLSGGQITQFNRFCNFCNLGKCSPSAFYHNQRLYISPAVEQEFQEQRDEVMKEFSLKGNDVVVCGDGRMDSPGFSATKGSYTIMDYDTKKLLTIELGDTREVSSPKILNNIKQLHLFSTMFVFLQCIYLLISFSFSGFQGSEIQCSLLLRISCWYCAYSILLKNHFGFLPLLMFTIQYKWAACATAPVVS